MLTTMRRLSLHQPVMCFNIECRGACVRIDLQKVLLRSSFSGRFVPQVCSTRHIVSVDSAIRLKRTAIALALSLTAVVEGCTKYGFTERDGRKGPPAENKARCKCTKYGIRGGVDLRANLRRSPPWHQRLA
jgi:hypothetical protein